MKKFMNRLLIFSARGAVVVILMACVNRVDFLRKFVYGEKKL